MRDANGHETTFEFDRMDRLIRETNPLGKVTAFTYAADGARLTKLDPKGQLIEYFHDSNRRLTDILYPDGSGTHFGYDERGNKIYEDNGTTSRSYVHDALNRVVQVTDHELGKDITYEYGPGGQRSKMIGPEGEETIYRYDASNRIRELVDPDGGRYVFGYDAAGRRTSLSFPNGVKAAYSYDQASRLVDMVYKNSAGDVLSSFAYTHDAAGNRLSKTLASGGVESYGYDQLHRLVDASYPSGRQVTYDYDPVGNRNFVQETSSGGSTETTTYTYSEFNQVLSTSNGAGVTTYGWDDNGNLAAKLSPSGAFTQYQYNYENRLSSILYAGGAINQFGYDTQGIRTMKQDSEGLQRYLIDQVSVLADYDGVGNQTARYTLNPQRIDEMLGQHQSQGKFYHLVDGLGSVYALTNEAGVKVASYGYDAYGATADAQVPTGLSNRWMFTGREMDADSGLQYNRARYYLSGVGSWNRVDPFEGTELYLGYNYVEGSPVSNSDPRGLFLLRMIVDVFRGGTAAKLAAKNISSNYISEGIGVATSAGAAVAAGGDLSAMGWAAIIGYGLALIADFVYEFARVGSAIRMTGPWGWIISFAIGFFLGLALGYVSYLVTKAVLSIEGKPAPDICIGQLFASAFFVGIAFLLGNAINFSPFIQNMSSSAGKRLVEFVPAIVSATGELVGPAFCG